MIAAAAAAAESAAGADDDADNNQSTRTHTCMPPKKKNASKYLPSDALTADPLENAVKRRRMLDDSDHDSSDDEGPGWRLTRGMMDRIDQSAWLRAELADGGLRQLICEIDGADQQSAAAQGSYHKKRNHRNRFADMGKVQMTPRELALEKARRTNPNFGRFVDRMMLTAGILATPDGSGGDPGAEGGGSGVSLEALLAGEEEGVGEMRNVQLVPVARPRSQLASETVKPSEAKDDVKAEDGDDSSSSSSSGEDGSSSEDDSSSEGEVEEGVS